MSEPPDAGTEGGAEPRPDPSPSVLDRLGELTGERPSVLLRGASPASADGVDIGKYVVEGEIARGGVGAVHRGVDRDLGRKIAIKFLHERYREHEGVLHRFVEEAQIGGQLQHPGIVPVYDLGLSNEQPFFTMKLVVGETLDQLLRSRESPSSERRRFLAIFEQICQAMAYAHARGVVHRDLKPANVMIGSFGEVQIVDWGMGKVLPRPSETGEALEEGPEPARGEPAAGGAPRRDDDAVATVRSSGAGTQSIVGSVMGTPSYMPPEQALGQVERMDERSDVFALGAVLCEILTGRPPYDEDPMVALGMAAQAELGDALERLERSDAEAELVALAVRCLAAEPADRPRSAQPVADAVQAHLSSVEQRAHEASIRAIALKRTQKYGLALLAVVAVGLATSLGFWRAAESAADSEREARGLAEAHLANFDRLSHVVRLENARSSAAALHPAWPAVRPAMERWLRDEARPLRDAVPELRTTLGEIEARAEPLPDAEQAEARRSHPLAGELDAVRTELASRTRAHRVRTGAAEAVEPELEPRSLPGTAAELNDLAWPLVDPHREVFGGEAEGLALARRAAAGTSEAGFPRAAVLDTLAWALFANGLDAEARERMEEAVAASGPEPGSFLESARALEEAIAAETGPEGQAVLASLRARAEELSAAVEATRWSFASDADRFLHETLTELVGEIEAFVAGEVARVEERIAWADRVEDLSIERHRERWEEARRAILAADGVTASERYAEVELDLRPQMGLVPIGMNPRTKLWEFYHLRSAVPLGGEVAPEDLEVPVHDEEGRLEMAGRGLVFVLVPGGRFEMGAQGASPADANFDPGATPQEGPVNGVELAPYFLSRFEATIGQWARLSGGEQPSWYEPGFRYPGMPEPIGDGHPVENVSWSMCDRLLEEHGLALPTEAQWERACRAGTSSAWFSGDDAGSLEGFANVLDETGSRVPPPWPGGEAFDDGYKGPAPVGTFRANAFGLHDMAGNLWEWCRDPFPPYAGTPRVGDGLWGEDPRAAHATSRGGSYADPAAAARSAYRQQEARTFRTNVLGVRPARRVED